MKFLTFVIMSSFLTSHVFAGDSVKASVDEILAAKRVVISPVTYKGYYIVDTIDGNDLCKFLGFSHAEDYTTNLTAFLYSRDRKMRIEKNGKIVTDDMDAIPGRNYYTSITCIK